VPRRRRNPPARVPARSRKGWIRIGISSCLLGEKVRWDGGHKRDGALTGLRESGVVWVPVCPETEVGMGVPREPVRLVGRSSSPRMVGVRSENDWTGRMERYARGWVQRAARFKLSGYVVKGDSPSCGMERVRVNAARGGPTHQGVGLFARALLEGMPLLPVEEERRLGDAAIRENFLERVLAFRRWQNRRASGCARGDLAAFHAAHELQILSHSPRHCRALEYLVSSACGGSAERLADRYGVLFMAALRIPATIPGHLRVLRRLSRLLRGRLTPGEIRRIRDALDGYRRGVVRRAVPLALLRRHVAHQEFRALRHQVYLVPDPRELILRQRAKIW